jgi:putative effector of murein hydrolase LrgA (UPF0299 family)
MRDTSSAILNIIIVMLCIGGWIANIIKLVLADHIGGMELLRLAGIFLSPLGAILGFF